MSKEIAKRDKNTLSAETDITSLFERCLSSVRDELVENPYIQEALRVLPVRGYRSAIGNLWNAVVDDLRNKIMHRSLPLFNKSINIGREIKTYDDFQAYVNDDQLIEGAYKIGVIGFEASKILKHAKETRHFFHGHPKSSEPSIIKVLSMMDDCVKYVLQAPYPAQIIDIDDYMAVMNTENFDRNEIAIETALTELPEIYKSELANRFFTSYVAQDASSVLRSNIEFVIPILWRVLSKEVQIQIVRRVDKLFPQGNSVATEAAFDFVTIVSSVSYLSPAARRYKIKPIVEKLKKNLDEWNIENAMVKELLPFASVIPPEAVPDYVWALTHTYVGHTGGSAHFARTNFYANGAALYIPRMFQLFDDKAGEAFVTTVKTSELLQSRIRNPAKLSRLRSLGNIVVGRVSAKFSDKEFLELMVDEDREEQFLKNLRKKL